MDNDLPLLIEQVIASCTDKAIWLAYSGGVDSHVLLHLLAANEKLSSARLHAIHIDHGLHQHSAQWAEHCAQTAKALGVDFRCIKVDVSTNDTEGLEAAARRARYQAIAEQLSKDDVVLTAQHQDDQAETLLLQLLRGAGPKGLSAMAGLSSLGEAQMLRPLLDITRADIQAYADQQQLQWIEDPSNADNQFNRNYLRHQVWPVITQRWPSASKTLSRSAQYCAEADALLAELAELDLAALTLAPDGNSLPVEGLLSLSPARCRNLLRYFIASHQFSLPSAVTLQRIIDEVCLAAEDSTPMIQWQGIEVRRYRGEVFFLAPMHSIDVSLSFLCTTADDLMLFEACCLTWLLVDNLGISQAMFDDGLQIGFRQGGEKIRLQGHQHHKSLKQLCQEWAIPPWQRDRIPLLFHDNELIAVVGYGLSEQCVLAPGVQGYLPMIKPR